MKEDAYKSLDFFNMMVELGTVCEECEDKPSFPDGWYFYLTPETVGSPIICPTCFNKQIKRVEVLDV